MSAETPKRTLKTSVNVVRPQPYSDKSVMESVVDFIQDVAYSQNSGPKIEEREKIQWLKFEQSDINDISSNPDCRASSGNTCPLLLVLGYKNGVQAWSVAGNGEAQEVLSLRQGPVKIFTFLRHPQPVDDYRNNDRFANRRPLVAVCDASSAGQPYCCVKFVSLKTGDEVHKLSFPEPVADVKVNRRVLVVAFKEKLAVHDACEFRQLFYITSCFPCPGPHPNPFAMGERWLAYSEKRLVAMHQSGGGMTGDGAQSYAATVISAAKTVSKGLSLFSQTVASSITGTKPGPSKKDLMAVDNNGLKPGVVTVIDTQRVRTSQVSMREDSEGEEFVAHFPAHATEPVYAMEFDPSGLMLLTADKLGHNFHVFRIMAHPHSCSLGAVHHLYTLYRGDTTAKVQDISFTADSRWVAVSTLRGTTHVFPITPYGGAVNVRTHTSQRVVNRASRFHRSAGLDEIPPPPRQSGRDSPVTSSPSSSPRQSEHYRHLNAINNNMGNPRLPPFPHPTTVQPLVQIRQSLTLPGLGQPTTSQAASKAGSQTSGTMESICLAACFGKSRGWVAGSPTVPRDKEDKRSVDSLYLLSWTGMLVEHVLEPHARQGLDKTTENSPLEVTETPRAQWPLARATSTPEVKPPLHSNNPLMVAHQAIITQTPTEEKLTRQESRESLASDHSSSCDPEDEWLSQVEMITHLGPHRRLWMGPQFSFKTYQGSASLQASSSSVLLSHTPDAPVPTTALIADEVDLQSLNLSPARSSPVAMPGGCSSRRSSSRHASGSDGSHCPSPTVHTFTSIEACSYESPCTDSNIPQWPDGPPSLNSGEVCLTELQQSLADAMTEAPAKDKNTKRGSLDIGSLENLSTSSGSASSAPRIHLFDHPPQTMDTVLMFPSSADSTDTSQ